ncbi:MAG: hypothetical protein E7262_03605 [Lachnospiraceae bacterium]|nr:hypothetical protein [Lachnospiraceae bacterium]
MKNNILRKVAVTATATIIATCMMVGTALAGVSQAGCPSTKSAKFPGVSIKHVKGQSEAQEFSSTSTATVKASGKFDGKYKSVWESEMQSMGYLYNVCQTYSKGYIAGYMDRSKATGTYNFYLVVTGTPLVGNGEGDSQKLDWVGQDYSKRIEVR